jgi:hypothetical protein
VTQYATVGAAASFADPVTAEGDARAYLLADSRFAAAPAGFHLEQGWHELEFDSWRWTARCFSVSLHLDAPLARPVLRFRFHVPNEAYERRRQLTLAASVNGRRLRPSVFDTSGVNSLNHSRSVDNHRLQLACAAWYSCAPSMACAQILCTPSMLTT